MLVGVAGTPFPAPGPYQRPAASMRAAPRRALLEGAPKPKWLREKDGGGEMQPAEPPEKSRHATPPPEAKPPTTNRATADRASNRTEPRSQPGPTASPLRSFPKRDVVSVTPRSVESA
jgi:hypothetical protein